MPDPDELLAKAQKPAQDALRWHPFYRGKMQTIPKCAIRSLADLAVWYTPGVAASSKAIASMPNEVYSQTNKGNTVAIVTDGSRVLGLGDIGPQAALPVMEGKALLFKYLGGIDAVPGAQDRSLGDAESPDDRVDTGFSVTVFAEFLKNDTDYGFPFLCRQVVTLFFL